MDSLSDVVLQADKSAFKAKKIGGPLPGNKLGAKNGARGLRDAMQMETLDFNKKILHASWHPRENTIAVRFVSSFGCSWTVNVYIYSLDRCNEQFVPVQCGVMFVVMFVKSIVQLCRRRHFLPTLPSSCRRLFLLSILKYIFRSLLFISLTLSTLYFTTIAHTRPLPFVPASFLLASYAAPTPLLDLRPHPFLVPARPLRSLDFPRSSSLTHARQHLLVQSPSVDQTRS